jgi:hypothetical protein
MAAPDPRVTAFAFRRQRLDGSAPTALAALEAAVAVYAVNPSGPLSVHARCATASAGDVLALERDGLAARSRAMRTSAFLVPSSTLPLVAAATDRPLERFSWMLRAANVPDDRFEGARAAVLRAVAEPVSARDARARAGLPGVDVARFLSYLALRGDVRVLGPESVTSNASRYVATQSMTGGLGAEASEVAAPAIDAAEAVPPVHEAAQARAWLAGAYLRSFGPARLADVAWWAAWPRGAAADAVAAHETVDTGGGRLLLAEDLEAFESTAPLPDDVTLVPKWDAWTMGYPLEGRERFLDLDVHDRVFDGDGNGLGAVLLAGRAVGAWGTRSAGARLEADLDLFDRASSSLREAAVARLGSIAAFLGYRDLRVRDVETVVPDRPRTRRPLG